MPVRRRASCRWCPGNGRHPPVGFCQDCGVQFCAKHGQWFEDRWLCSHCLRLIAKG